MFKPVSNASVHISIYTIANTMQNKLFYEIYLTQCYQAMAIKTAAEHMRQLKPFCSGICYWQLNDVHLLQEIALPFKIWPGASWSSIEYDCRFKMLHYWAKDFYAPLLVVTYAYWF